MRVKLKYKIYKQLKYTKFEILPERILSFKRPCWQNIQQQYTKLRKKKRKIVFNNSINFSNNTQKWMNFKKLYLNSLILKRRYYQIFDFGIKIPFLKKYKVLTDKTDLLALFTYFLITPYYRIDILLWMLHFYNSIYQVKQDLVNKHILINNNIVKFNYFLKKGDIIQFMDNKHFSNFKSILLLKHIKRHFLTFIEVDYYSKSLIIIKDASELTTEEILLINPNFFDFKKFFDQIRYK